MAAWQDLRALRDPDAWDPWVRRLTVNACYKAAGKHRRRTRVEIQVEADPRSTQAPDPAADVADRELIDVESNEKVWLNQKKIKKYIGKGRYSA